jgi:ABC-type glycerol-3-phosphate transport system substrate-binding protein
MKLSTITMAVAFAALVAPAFAQDFKTEWARTVAAASEEGEVVINSQANQAARNYLETEWPKAYPKIKLNISVLREPQILARVRTERQAGKYLWDASVAVTSAGYILAKEGALDPLLPEMIDPDVNKPELWGGWDDAFVDAPKKYVLATVSYIASPYYNAGKISPEVVAKQGLKILLDPQYAGKIYWHEPTVAGGGRTYAQLIHSALGDDGLRKLLTEQKVVFTQEQHQVVEAMARGTAWIGIGPPVVSLIKPYQKAGVDIQVRPFGNTPETGVQSVGGAGVYVFNKRPHPNATRVFINWLLSEKTQEGYSHATEQASRRTDVPHAGEPETKPIKGAKYITTQREDNKAALDKTIAFIEEVRRNAK